MIEATINRFKQFNELRTSKLCDRVFWDVVVLTAADELQKTAFEKQLQIKLKNCRIPPSADYLVVADPPNFKIGNGGSTLVVLQALHDKYGDSFTSKRTIIIHAGGFSQRLPNASVVGKAFMAIPSNDAFYEMLEVKLASYIDLPSKIVTGGIYVCCADTFEAYHDDRMTWAFSQTGFTGLAHPSPLEIGETHGVYVLENAEVGLSLKRRCRRFLHKPSISTMTSTRGCVFRINTDHDTNELILSDSAFFISPPACRKLFDFYKKHSPLLCEVDAYGDFLQSLGSQANCDYVKNVANVVNVEPGLIQLRQALFDHLQGTNLDVIVLAPLQDAHARVDSRFCHFGTNREYLELFTNDRIVMEMLSVSLVSHSVGSPFKYVAGTRTVSDAADHAVPHTALGLMGDIQAEQYVAVLPCIMYSIVHPGVSVGEHSIIEYCTLREGVTVAGDCIISHCTFEKGSSVPAGTFMHTVPVYADNAARPCTVGYCTLVFGIDDNLKASSAITSVAQLHYLGRKLGELFSDSDLLFRGIERESVSLWEMKLFEVFETARDSSAAACQLLKQLSTTETTSIKSMKRKRLSMSDLLKVKNIDEMLRYRSTLQTSINKVQSEQSILPQLELFASKPTVY